MDEILQRSFTSRRIHWPVVSLVSIQSCVHPFCCTTCNDWWLFFHLSAWFSFTWVVLCMIFYSVLVTYSNSLPYVLSYAAYRLVSTELQIWKLICDHWDGNQTPVTVNNTITVPNQTKAAISSDPTTKTPVSSFRFQWRYLRASPAGSTTSLAELEVREKEKNIILPFHSHR